MSGEEAYHGHLQSIHVQRLPETVQITLHIDLPDRDRRITFLLPLEKAIAAGRLLIEAATEHEAIPDIPEPGDPRLDEL